MNNEAIFDVAVTPDRDIAEMTVRDEGPIVVDAAGLDRMIRELMYLRGLMQPPVDGSDPLPGQPANTNAVRWFAGPAGEGVNVVRLLLPGFGWVVAAIVGDERARLADLMTKSPDGPTPKPN